MNSEIPNQLELKIRENAIYSPNKIKSTPVNKILEDHNLQQIGKGFMTRVYKIRGQDWVIKEGRWDLDFQPIKHLTVKLPREATQKFFKAFELNFLPTEEVVAEQYEHYLKFANYFGYFEKPDVFHHPRLKHIFKKQKSIRDSLLKYKEEINNHYSINLNSNLEKILNGEVKNYNFLPKEYLLYGKSIHKKNKGKNTFFIFQKHIEGKTLFEHDTKNLDRKTVKKMVLLSYLILLLNLKEQLVVDMRPKHILQTHDWFGDTDNIILNEKGPVLIDTRWMWESDSSFVKRGFLIPDLIILRTKHYLNHYLQNL